MDPANDVPFLKKLGQQAHQSVFVYLLIDRARRIQVAPDVPVSALRSKRRPGHADDVVTNLTPLTMAEMLDRERTARRSIGVAGGRLNPHIFERTFTQETSVCHAVKSHTTGQT